jgi:hypothetical protein
MVDGALHTHTVVAEGPYRFVCNPLYLGTNLLAVGYSVMASRLGAALLVGGVILFNYRIILREERALALAQGENYESFRQVVPRLWPSLRPRALDRSASRIRALVCWERCSSGDWRWACSYLRLLSIFKLIS